MRMPILTANQSDLGESKKFYRRRHLQNAALSRGRPEHKFAAARHNDGDNLARAR
jgi:hypothetical protein